MLCVLAIRFQQSYVHTLEMDWHQPFNIDISFVGDLLDSTSPVDLARALTDSDMKAFANLASQNITDEDDVTQYFTKWHSRSVVVWEYCSAFAESVERIQELTQVSIYCLF